MSKPAVEVQVRAEPCALFELPYGQRRKARKLTACPVGARQEKFPEEKSILGPSLRRYSKRPRLVPDLPRRRLCQGALNEFEFPDQTQCAPARAEPAAPPSRTPQPVRSAKSGLRKKPDQTENEGLAIPMFKLSTACPSPKSAPGRTSNVVAPFFFNALNSATRR